MVIGNWKPRGLILAGYNRNQREKHAKEEDLQDIWPSPQCRGASEQQAQMYAGVVSRDRGSLEKLRHVKGILLPSSLTQRRHQQCYSLHLSVFWLFWPIVVHNAVRQQTPPNWPQARYRWQSLQNHTGPCLGWLGRGSISINWGNCGKYELNSRLLLGRPTNEKQTNKKTQSDWMDTSLALVSGFSLNVGSWQAQKNHIFSVLIWYRCTFLSAQDWRKVENH